jgi:DNA mismatch repair protein MutL
MNRIQILPSEIADQIAAGEVVERPASAVKELVENSLDAGARRVDVETQGAGRQLVRILDDGSGMSLDDLKLCVARHATSKIARADDLWSVATFGFRGEALPSIASVSHFSIASRAQGSGSAWRLEVEGGLAAKPQEDALAKGTLVEVRGLFFNTPARLKFLKSPATENSRIQQALSALALAHPQVSFRLRSEGRPVFDFTASDQAGRAAQVLGASEVGEALAVEYASPGGGPSVTGWTFRPQAHRGSRGGQHLFVNGRPVEHRLFNWVLSQAYGSLIPHGRFAQALLFLKVPVGSLDVNVHPAKKEVRFGDEKLVLDVLRRAVSAALAKGNFQVPVDLARSASVFSMQDTSRTSFPPPSPLHPRDSVPAVFEGMAPYELPMASASHQTLPAAGVLPPASGRGTPAGWPTPLAQLHRSYLLCQSDEGLVLVDQHAAHERVLYEKALRALGTGNVESQGLLLPQKLKLGPESAARLSGWLTALAGFGVEMSDLGNGDFFITAVPAFLKNAQLPPLLQDLLKELPAEPSREEDPLDPFRQEVASRLACRAAIKAGDAMNLEEMQGLLRQLSACSLPWACPHGRPPLVSISLVELEKYFQRR